MPRSRKKRAAARTPTPAAGTGGSDDGVVDADFEEVDDTDDQQKRSA